ncbi:diaminopimelate epimerase [Ascidiimonas aurantiaca]|uniref:diaminopimelate epimerase n=1 Tax=Ascidiimonas aurantiaca TaxID=1685432 RepID=UPI0030EC8F82
MVLSFYKYQGTGNDFIIIDNRADFFLKNDTKLIKKLCDRKFGIGADGLILLETDTVTDFKMVYFNSDGRESSMCGNGGRCLVSFAHYLGIIKDNTVFTAIDGIHKATIVNAKVHLQMNDVTQIDDFENHSFLNTGSPHHVQMVTDLSSLNMKKAGAALRYGKYGEEGANINFVESLGKNTFAVRTYERGVEDETLSCGTGVTAVALALHKRGQIDEERAVLQTEGGKLEVSFKKNDLGYSNVYLSGPAIQVFKGEIIC